MSEPVGNNDDLNKAGPDKADPPSADMPIAETSPEPNKPEAEKWVDTAATGKKKRLNPALITLSVLLAVFAIGTIAWVVLHHAPEKTQTAALPAEPVAAGPLAPYAKGSMAKLVTFAEPKVIENIAFMDRNKKAVNLSDFKGQVVVLNVWATWCAPCRFEMPTLAHLQKMNAGKAVKVLPLSVDTEDKFADVVSFIDVQEPLNVYADPNFQAPSKYGISGMPATLILDKKGREVARLDGEATWDTPEVQALLDKLLSE